MWQPPPPPRPGQGPRLSTPLQMYNPNAAMAYGQPHPYGGHMMASPAMGGVPVTNGMAVVNPSTGAWIDPAQYVHPNFDMSMYQEYQMFNGLYSYPQGTAEDYDSDEDDEIPSSHPALNHLNLNDKQAKKTVVEMVCDVQYNVNNVLATNIMNSDYFRELFALKTFHEVIQEVNKKVTHLEALTIGQTRLPSTAFCLLYKLFTLKLTVKQLCSMLSERKSAFIRGLGLLYLRFVHPPKQLWHWLAPLLKDTTDFYPSGPSAPSMTLGEFAKKLLTELQYPGILLPRIPVPVLREYKKLILTGADSRTEPVFNDNDNEEEISDTSMITIGSLVRAQYYEDGKYYDAIIKEVISAGKYRVAFIDYDDEESEVSAIKPISDRKQKEKDRRCKEREIEEQIRRQERASALAHGKDYASRPASCKATMSINEHKRRRSRTPPRREREVIKKLGKPQSPSRQTSSVRESTDLSRRQAELLAKYGDASANKKPV